MVYKNALNSYQKAQLYDEMDPNKLIFLLYEGAVKRIKLAKKGVINDDPKLRGENLGKAIAIVSELNASLDDSIKTEEILFLKGLYTSMLVELPKVAVSNDIKTLDRAERYLTELKKIWKTTVMNGAATKTGLTGHTEQQLNGGYKSDFGTDKRSFAI